MTDLALYVHWPFCVSKCPYCDFNSHVRDTVDQAAWRDALLADLAHEAALLPGRRLTSIFFGGGTPSLMDPATVEAVIAAAARHWPAADDVEITLEANPNSAEAARFADLAAAGVNRISLGLQSFDDASLAFLGRAHSADEGQRALDAAQGAVDRVSFDLIYALPGDDEAEWSATLDRALALGTEHLSLYQLTIEPGTRFATMVAQARLRAARRRHRRGPVRADAGTAPPPPACPPTKSPTTPAPARRAATTSPTGATAIMPGSAPAPMAAGSGMRTVRHKKPENFLAAVARNGHGLVEEEPLTPTEGAQEALVMGLRLAEGIDPDALASRASIARWSIGARSSALQGHGLLAPRRRAARAPPSAGRLLLDSILAEIAA